MIKNQQAVLVAVILLICLINTSCKSEYNSPIRNSEENMVYENEFFSLEYPRGWIYEEEIRNFSIPERTKSIHVTFNNVELDRLWQEIVVVKSSRYESNVKTNRKTFKTPEEVRDFSVQMLSCADDYIGTINDYMLDSLRFDSYPAAMAGFASRNEAGDTIIHKQMIIMVGKDFYYLNHFFDWRDDGTLEKKGDSVLSTFRIIPQINQH